MRRVLGFLSVFAVVFLGVGCLTWPSAWFGESGPYVGVIGDSLMQAAENGGGIDPNDPDHFLTNDVAEAGYRVSLSAFLGATTSDLLTLGPFPDPGPEVLVIGLGTNDMRHAVPEDAVDAIGNIVSFLDGRPAACTALITIIDAPSWGLDVTAPVYNAALAQLAAERGNAVVADWAAMADAHPEYIGSDGVHHTASGRLPTDPWSSPQ